MATDYKIYHGDVLDVLRGMPAESVQCVVTSPPYYGLRDYGTAQWEGGDVDCLHQESQLRLGVNLANSPASTRGGAKKIAEVGFIQYKDICQKCGAKRIDNQIGLEETPAEYVQKMVDVFAEVWRVLRPDGTLWLNLGDSYANDTKWGGSSGGKHVKALHGNSSIGRTKKHTGLKSKDLVGIPWRVAFALQDFGWYLRQEIIWHKPNPMPESVTDRCTKSHEHIFLLTKSSKYFFDSDAIREPHQDKNVQNGVYIKSAVNAENYQPNNQGFYGQGMITHHRDYNPNGRNKRSVWTVSTKPFPDAHFATFPEKLIEPCILAGTSEKGACAACGAPYERHVEKETDWQERKQNGATSGNLGASDTYQNSVHGNGNTHHYLGTKSIKEIGWRKSCACETEEIKPCVVLDPFAGAGTTLLVALKHKREAIGIELNAKYIRIAEKRLSEIQINLF